MTCNIRDLNLAGGTLEIERHINALLDVVGLLQRLLAEKHGCSVCEEPLKEVLASIDLASLVTCLEESRKYPRAISVRQKRE